MCSAVLYRVWHTPLKEGSILPEPMWWALSYLMRWFTGWLDSLQKVVLQISSLILHSGMNTAHEVFYWGCCSHICLTDWLLDGSSCQIVSKQANLKAADLTAVLVTHPLWSKLCPRLQARRRLNLCLARFRDCYFHKLLLDAASWPCWHIILHLTHGHVSTPQATSYRQTSCELLHLDKQGSLFEAFAPSAHFDVALIQL